MYQLEDRILFDGAAIVDAAAAQQALNDQQAEAQEAHAAQDAEDQKSQENSSQDGGQNASGHGDAHSGPAGDAADAADAALGLDSDDVQDFLTNSLSETVADGSLKVYIAASDSLQLDALRDAADDNTLVIEYDADSTTKADLMRMLSETLNGRKADSITFIDADGADDALAQPLDSAGTDADAGDELAVDFSADEFEDSVSGLVADDADVHYLDATDADDMAQLTADLDADRDVTHDDLGDNDDSDHQNLADTDDADGDHDDIAAGTDRDVIDDYAAQLDILNDVPQQRHEIVFIDSKVQDIDRIVSSIDPSAEIVFLSGKDTIAQISDYLAQYDGDVDAIHFITHGAQGMVRIGDQDVNLDYLTANRSTFADWGKALSNHGDIMFYGCNIANGAEGQALVNAIAVITGADVAATSRAAGGKYSNWDLEYQVGLIDTTNISVDGYDANLAAKYNFIAAGDGDWSTIEWTLNENTDDKYDWAYIQTILGNSEADDVTITIGKKVVADIGDYFYTYTGSDNVTVEVVKDGVLTVSDEFSFYGSTGKQMRVDAEGALVIADGGTFKVGGTASAVAFTGNGAITIATGGEMQVVSGNVFIKGSINPTPGADGDNPPPASNMFNPVGKLTQTGGNLHFRGAEIATLVNSTGGTFYYDGEGAQAMAGGGSVYTDVVVSGGAKTLWGNARVEGEFTFAGSTDVYLSAYDPNHMWDQLSGKLTFSETASVNVGTGSFIVQYDVLHEYTVDDVLERDYYYITPGYLAFELRKDAAPIRVSVGTDLLDMDDWDYRNRNYTTLQLSNVSTTSGPDLMTITLGAVWNYRTAPVGIDDPGYTRMDFSIAGLTAGSRLRFNVVGYSRGAVTDNFSYAMASVYNASGKIATGDTQFTQYLTANGTYHFQSKAVDSGALLVTNNLDGEKATVGSLRVAVDYANRFGGEITFSDNMRKGTVDDRTIILDGMDMIISGEVKIAGWSSTKSEKLITISGGGKSGIFSIAGTGTLTLTNMNLTAGYSAGNGGAIYNAGILEMTDVNITGSNAKNGGAIYAAPDSVTKLFKVVFTENRAVEYGGAMYIAGGALVSGERVRVIGNEGNSASWSQNAKSGGAFFIGGGEGLVDEEAGPLVTYQGGSLHLKNSTIMNNVAEQGSAIYTIDDGFEYDEGEGDDKITMFKHLPGAAMLDAVTINDNIATATTTDILTGNTYYNGATVYADGRIYGVNVTAAYNTGYGFMVGKAGELTLENSTIAFNGFGRDPDPMIRDQYNVGIVRNAGGYIYLSWVLDTDNTGSTTVTDNYGVWFTPQSLFGRSRESEFIGKNSAYLLQDNGGWVLTMAVTRSISNGEDGNTGETNLDARGFIYNEAIYDHNGVKRVTYRSVGAYQYNAAMVWNANNNNYYLDIQSAVDAAKAGEELHLAKTRITDEFFQYHAAGQMEAGSEIVIAKDLILVGEGMDDTMLDARGNSRIFNIDNGKEASRILVRIGGMTLTGGVADLGGAIYNRENLVLVQVGLVDNKATNLGGALYNKGGYVIAEQATFEHNSAANQGGAIYSVSSSMFNANIMLSNSGLQYNTARDGGAIYQISYGNYTAGLVTENSLFAYNEANGGVGGAVYAQGTVEMTNTTVAFNYASDGSALRFAFVNGKGKWSLTNVTVGWNESLTSTVTGALAVDGGTLTLVNSLVSMNNIKYNADGTLKSIGDIWGLDAQGNKISVNGKTVKFKHTNSVFQYRQNQDKALSANPINTAWQYDPMVMKSVTTEAMTDKMLLATLADLGISGALIEQYFGTVSNALVTTTQYSSDAIYETMLRYDTADGLRFTGRLTDQGGWTRALAISPGGESSAKEMLGTRVLSMSTSKVPDAGMIAIIEAMYPQIKIDAANKTLSYTQTVKGATKNILVNQGTNSGALEYDQRGYLVNGTRDIGAFEYRGFIGMASFYDPYAGANVTIGITSLNEINGFGNNLRSGNLDSDYYSETGMGAKGEYAAEGKAYKDITVVLANTRVIDFNVQLNTMWTEIVSTGGFVGGQRTITILGAEEGGTVLDANNMGEFITAWGGFYTTPSTIVWVMGNVSLERLTVTGAVGDYGSAIHTKRLFTPAGGSINLTDVSLTDNISRLGGGGLHGRTPGDPDYMKEVTYNVTRSLIAYNLTAGSGGGIAMGNVANIADSTLAYNIAGGNGGAISLGVGGGLTVSGSTLAYNHATGEGGGGGIYNCGAIGGVSGSIIAKNRTVNAFQHYEDYSTGTPTSLKTGPVGNQLGDYDYVWGHKDAGLPGAGTYNVVEIQNGEYFAGDPATTYYFAPRSIVSDYYYSTTGSQLGFTVGLFQNGYLSDNGGWSHTMALGQKSVALDWTMSTSSSDQRGYDNASGNVNQQYRDAGAFELNGAFISLVNAAGVTERFNDFTMAVNAATAGSTLSVKAVRVKAYDVEITKSVTIKLVDGANTGSYPLVRGEHAYVDAGYNGRVFSITNASATVVMDGLYLYKGLSLIASTEAPTSAAGNGGAIYNTGTLTLNNVSVASSFAQQFGGAVFSSKSLTITSDGSYGLLPSSFHNNRALQGGGIYARGRLSVTGSKASMLSTQPTYNGDGGGTLDVLATAALNQGSIQFRDNVADDGAAMFIADLTATGSVTGAYFAANQAANQGGAIYASRNAGINFTDVLFYNNMSLGDGGALFVSGGSLGLHDSILYTNMAFQSGGALYAVGVDTITIHAGNKSSSGTLFDGNVAIEGNGGAVYVDNFNTISVYGDLHLYQVVFQNNETIFGSGGAIYAQNGTTLALGDKTSGENNVSFYNNQAGTDSRNAYYLGATHESGLSSGAINNMMNQYANGGAIYGININAVTMFSNIVFLENSAFTYGGALYLERVKSFSTGRNVQFLYNLAGHTGGTRWEGAFDVTGDINKVQANGAGGAAYLVNVANINLDYTVIGGNYSGLYSWDKFFEYALEANRGSGTLSKYLNGGGFYIVSQTVQEPAPVITMNDLDVFDNNRVVVNDKVTVNGKAVEFARLNQESKGGAFYIESPNAVLTVTNSGFDNNEAGFGGAIYIAKAVKTVASQTVNELTMKSASFTNVSFGSNRGTALRIEGLTNSLTLNYTTFAYNTLSSNGTTGLYFGGFTSADATAKFALTLTNNIFYEETGKPVELTNLPTGSALKIVSGQNVFFRYDQFLINGKATMSGASFTAEGLMLLTGTTTRTGLNTIYAYKTSAKTGKADGYRTLANLLDGAGNIVGTSTSTNSSISKNLYLSNEMEYHANYLTRAMALESANSIAYHYAVKDPSNSKAYLEVRPGGAVDGDFNIATDQRGNVRTGLQLIPVVAKDGTVTYTYKFYLYDKNEEQWYEVVLEDGKDPVKTAIEKDDVAKTIRTSLGAFEPNFYMAVTSNLDNQTNGFNFIKNGNEEWHDIATALTGLTEGGIQFTDGGVTLREALYWMDNYTLGGENNSSVEFIFDPYRYIRFSDNMYVDGKNTIELKSGQITIKQDVIVGMVDQYEQNTTGTVTGNTYSFRFKADSTFRAQDDLSRITISGSDQSRVFYVDYTEDYTTVKMRELTSNFFVQAYNGQYGISAMSTKEAPNGETDYIIPFDGGLSHWAQVGLNNLTVTNGHQGYNEVISASGSILIGGTDAGRGGAIFNEGRLVMHNTVVKDSLATNADFSGAGSFAGWGGGIFNDRKIQLGGVDIEISYILKRSWNQFYLVTNGELYMYDSTVTNNRAQALNLDAATEFGGIGGGIANVGKAYIVRSAIDNNVAEGFWVRVGDTGYISALGGGIYNGSYYYDNEESLPGYAPTFCAVYSGSLEMYSSTVTANKLDYNIGDRNAVFPYGGSAVHVSGGKAVLVGNTIAYNEAHRYDDGMGYAVVFNNEMRDGKAEYILANNIIANNYVPGIDPKVGRDLYFIELTVYSGPISSRGGNNIVGSVFGYADQADYYTDKYYFGDELGNNTLGTQSNGYVDKLYLSSEFKYNGGMTKNLRLGAGSIAYTLNNVDKQVAIYDWALLDVDDPVFGKIYAAALGDQRGLTAWGYDSNGVEVYRNPSTTGSKWIYADGTACTDPNVKQVQTRNTIGAYEMLTYVVSDTSVADQALPGGNIHYDYSFVDTDTGYSGRNGWNVNLRQALYLADDGATVIFRVAEQMVADTELVFDDDGNPVYLVDENGDFILDDDGNKIQETKPVYVTDADGNFVLDEFDNPIRQYVQATDEDGNLLYHDLFELKYGELNIFNSLTFQVKSTDRHGLTIDALNLSRAFNIDGSSFEVPNPKPLQVTIMGDDLPVNPDDVSVALTVVNTAAIGTESHQQQGGAIFANGDLALINVDFLNSQAKADGGAIYVANGDLVLNTVNFNRAADPDDPDFDAGSMTAGGNGGAIYVEGAATLTNVTIYNTTAGGDGGAVYIANALTASSFIDVTIDGATAQNGNGGAVYFYGGDLTLENVYIANSSASAKTDSSYGLGGAMYINSSGNVIFGNEATGLGVTMAGNAAVAGGAVYIANAKLVSISQGSFVNNTATGYPGAYGHGGGIYIVGTAGMSIRIVNTTIANNTAVGNGGGLFVGNGEVMLQSVTLTNNIAGYGQPVHVPSDNAFGGGIYMTSGTLSMDNTIVAQNFVNTDLAIVDAVKPGRATRNDIHLNLNRASYGTVTYSVVGTLSGTALPAGSIDAHSYRMGDGTGGTTKWEALSLATSVLELSGIKDMAGTIPTFIVYVYDGVGAIGGNPSLTVSRDQLGRVRAVDPSKITMGAYQRITVTYTLNGDDVAANVGVNWKDEDGNAGSDSIFKLPDVVLEMYATNVYILNGQFNGKNYNGIWEIGPLGQVKMKDGSTFAIDNNTSMIGRMDVENGATLTIDVKDANIADLVFLVAEKSTVIYGQEADLLRSMEYGNLIVKADGTHDMDFDGTELVVRGTFMVEGVGAEDNVLNLSGKEAIEVTVLNQEGLDPAMTVSDVIFNLGGSLEIDGNLALTDGTIMATGDVSADVINGVNGSITSGGDVSFLSVFDTDVTAAGAITVGDGVTTSTVRDSNLSAGTDILFRNDVDFDGDVDVTAKKSITVTGAAQILGGSLQMTAGTKATFDKSLTALDGTTLLEVTANDLVFNGSVSVASGLATLTAVDSMHFNGYQDSVTVGADAYLKFVLESEDGVIQVTGQDGVIGDPLFDVRNIAVAEGGRLDFVTGGELQLGDIPDGAADDIYGTLGLFSSNTITVGAAGTELVFNNATVIFGSDVLIAGPTISIDHGVQFLGNVTVADGIGAVTVEAEKGTVIFAQELVGNGDDFTITGMDVQVNTIRNVDNLTITATDTTGDGTIALGGSVTVSGDIVLSSQNPIKVTGDAGLSGLTLTTDAPFQGDGSLSLDFSDPDAISSILGVELGGVLTLVQGNYVIDGVMNVGGLVTGQNTVATVKVDMVVNGDLNNAGTLTAEKPITVTGDLTNTGTLVAENTVTVSGDLVNSGTLTAAGLITIGGDLTNTGTLVAENGIELTGSLTTEGDFTVKEDLVINGNITNNGNFTAEKNVTAGGDVTSDGTFKVIGALDVGGDLSTKGTFEANDTVKVAGDVTNEGVFTADGLVDIGGDLSTDGSFTAGSDVLVGGSVINSGEFEVAGGLQVGNDMFSDGDVTVAGLVQIGGRLTTFGSLEAEAVEVGDSWRSRGDVTVQNDVNVGGDLVSDGSFTAGGIVTVDGSLGTSGSFTAAEVTVGGNAVLDGSFTVDGDVTVLGALENFGDLTVGGDLLALQELSSAGTLNVTGAVRTEGDLTNYGVWNNGGDLEIGGDFLNYGNFITIGDAVLSGNLTNYDSLWIQGTLLLNGTARQILDMESGTTRVGGLTLDNAAGADMTGRSELTVDGAFTFGNGAGRMNIGDGRLSIGGAIVGNNSTAYFMLGGLGRVYLNLTTAQLPGNGVWIGNAEHVGKVVMTTTHQDHVVGLGTYAPMNKTGQPGGDALRNPSQAYDRSITIDSGDLDLNVDLSEAYDASERRPLKDTQLFGYGDGQWTQLKPTEKGSTVYNVSGNTTFTYAAAGFDFAGKNDPLVGGLNLYQRNLRDMAFVSTLIRDPERNQYELSLANMRFQWNSNAETNPLDTQLVERGSALAAPVRLGLLGGYTVYGSPIDDTLLDDGVTLNPLDNNRIMTIERDEVNDRADWMEAFATLAEREEIQERHPAFQDSVDRAIAAFLSV